MTEPQPRPRTAPRAQPPQQTAGARIRSWIVPVSIVVIAGVLIALVLVQFRGSSTAAPTVAAPEIDLSYVESRDPADVQAMGPIDAPVGLVIYSDYQCPYCAQWSEVELPAMQTAAKLGDLRIEWRDVNQYGPDSERAAIAAYAAGQQDKFWEYHSALFRDGVHRSPEQLSEAALTAVAAELQLDLARFATDLASPDALAAVREHAAAGRELGVAGTPTFVLGGLPIVGAQPSHVFTDALTAALAAAHSGAGAGAGAGADTRIGAE